MLSKGASLVRSINKYLGEEIFWESIKHFIQQNVHQSVDSDLLYESFEIKGGVDLKSLINHFVIHAGINKFFFYIFFFF